MQEKRYQNFPDCLFAQKGGTKQKKKSLLQQLVFSHRYYIEIMRGKAIEANPKHTFLLPQNGALFTSALDAAPLICYYSRMNDTLSDTSEPPSREPDPFSPYVLLSNFRPVRCLGDFHAF
ncbi:MAG: hypothetical protein LWX00_01080 [Spirochaetia bacterium]|nr:hypothetical protein [Spirochaetia bacterium]